MAISLSLIILEIASPSFAMTYYFTFSILINYEQKKDKNLTMDCVGTCNIGRMVYITSVFWTQSNYRA